MIDISILVAVLLVLFTIAVVIEIMLLRIQWTLTNYFLDKVNVYEDRLEAIENQLVQVKNYGELLERATALMEARSIGNYERQIDEIIAHAPTKASGETPADKQRASEAKQVLPKGRPAGHPADGPEG